MPYRIPPLDDADRRVLDELGAMRCELRHILRGAPRWERQFRRNLTARHISGSNAIEGYVSSVDDVEALIAGEETLDTPSRSVAEVLGCRQAMTYIQSLANA